MTDPPRAVFLSYASQDAEAARRICDALREIGLEVWFDQRELRGGDAWDQRIRREIRDCALFVPIISANTHARLEGYFRREWKLAIARTHDMAEEKAFLLPVVVDDTNPLEASVPEPFRAVHWTRLAAGEVPPEFVARVSQLLSALEPGRPTAARLAPATAAAVRGVSYHAQGRPTDALAALAAMLREPNGSEFQIAEAYACLGDVDQAFRWLEAAVAHRDPGVLWLRGDPLLKGLTDDARYAALLRTLNLPQ